MARDDYSVAVFISLLHVITATSVYYVTPDDQSHINNDRPIDHECHTLQYYLLNNSKYFTSNTQLHFLQGSFYINADIVIDNLHNFSLVGSGVDNTIIECSTPSLIAIINCTNTVIKNITTGSQCGSSVELYDGIAKVIRLRILSPVFFDHKPRIKSHASIFVFDCYSTLVHSVLIKTHGILIINGLGNTSLTDISLCDSGLEIFYGNTVYHRLKINDKHVLQLVSFNYCVTRESKTVAEKLHYIIKIEFWQIDYNTEVLIEDSVFQFLRRIELISIYFWISNENKTLVTIKGCQFLSNSGVFQINSAMITVAYSLYYVTNKEYELNINNTNKVQILDSSFMNNTANNEPAIIIKLYLLLSYYKISDFTLSNCTFVMNSNFVVLKTLYS